MQICFKNIFFIVLLGMSFPKILDAQQQGGAFIMSSVGSLTNMSNNSMSVTFNSSAACLNIQNGTAVIIGDRGVGSFAINCDVTTHFNTLGIKMYPNPVKNELYINILHANKGNDMIELLDEKGVKLKEKIVVYNGMGALEIWNLAGLKAGQYFVNIRHTHPVTGRLIKKGAFKILKVN